MTREKRNKKTQRKNRRTRSGERERRPFPPYCSPSSFSIFRYILSPAPCHVPSFFFSRSFLEERSTFLLRVVFLFRQHPFLFFFHIGTSCTRERVAFEDGQGCFHGNASSSPPVSPHPFPPFVSLASVLSLPHPPFSTRVDESIGHCGRRRRGRMRRTARRETEGASGGRGSYHRWRRQRRAARLAAKEGTTLPISG